METHLDSLEEKKAHVVPCFASEQEKEEKWAKDIRSDLILPGCPACP